MPAWACVERLAYHLVFNAPTPSNNVIKGMHFHAYKNDRRKWSQAVLAAVGGERPAEPLELSGLVVVRGSAGSLDWDNAYGGLKPLLDSLVMASNRNPDGLGLIRDDNPGAMPCPPHLVQVSAKQGEGFTEVFVFAL